MFCVYNMQKENLSFRGTFQPIRSCTGREKALKVFYKELCLEAKSPDPPAASLVTLGYLLNVSRLWFSLLFHKE